MVLSSWMIAKAVAKSDQTERATYVAIIQATLITDHTITSIIGEMYGQKHLSIRARRHSDMCNKSMALVSIIYNVCRHGQQEAPADRLYGAYSHTWHHRDWY